MSQSFMFSRSNFSTLPFTILALMFSLFLLGCDSSSSPSTSSDLDLPETNWTEGERSVKNAPESGEYKVKFETTAGDFTMLVHRDWAPKGAERFYQLIKSNYYDGAPFYRVMPGFMVQFGMNGDAKGSFYWDQEFRDDPVLKSNKRAMVSYAMSGPNSRTTQLFINYADNSRLDAQGFSPFAEVVEGMEAVDSINSKYAERPRQDLMMSQGNEYVFKKFPEIDYIIKTTLVE